MTLSTSFSLRLPINGFVIVCMAGEIQYSVPGIKAKCARQQDAGTDTQKNKNKKIAELQKDMALLPCTLRV